MKNNLITVIKYIFGFLALNILLYVFCFIAIVPYFKVSMRVRTFEEKKNEIIFNDYKLNVKKITTKEDYIVNMKTNKEIHNK